MPRTHQTSPSPSPPPASFPFAIGSFDFPQASASPPPPPPRSQTSARSRVNQLTEFLNQHYQQSATDPEDGITPLQPSQWARGLAPRANATRRRPPTRNQRILRHAEREPDSISMRPTATPSERYLRRAHQRVRDARSVIEDPTTDILDSLSDFPLNPFHASHFSRRERSPPNGSDIQRRQTKRRKLDHPAKPASEYDGFRYGYKGQVARGRLRMEVVSCDGGEYDRESSLYRVQNVLSNDKSVYCSQSERCNLLLRHIGEMPFCLEKVVIRAPDRGFTAPVQEGLIFVAMSPEKLLSGTSAYRIEYNLKDSVAPSLHRSPSLRGSPEAERLSFREAILSEPISPDRHGSPEAERLSFREAILDEAIWERSRQAMTERIERLRLRSRRYPGGLSGLDMGPSDAQQNAGDDDGQNECPYHIEEGDPNAAGVSAPTPPPFTTTTESEPEDSEEIEAMPSAAIMADRLRRESRYRSEDEDDDDRDELIHPFTLRRAEALDSLENYESQARRWRNQQRSYEPIRATRLRTPSRIEPERAQADSEDVIKPHARFFIARNKNKITIKFHPTISGKHILLKLWSPTHDGNIDIESVQFYGYSGPRFFPATQPC